MFHLNTTGEALDLGDPLEDARLKLLFGLDPDVAQEGSGHFRECALDQVEPGAMLWRVHVLEVRISAHRGRHFRLIVDAISAGSWTVFQSDRGRRFSGIVDDGGGAQVIF